jgi:hypothetical protein
VLQEDKIFRSPYDETSYTVDLTWPQYERSTSITGARSSLRREPLTIVKKDRLLPIKYEGDTEIELDWDNVEVNSIIRAVVGLHKILIALIK